MKKLILAILLVFSGANATKSVVECRYILHGLENELWLILGYTYAINGYATKSVECFNQIWIYPEEETKVDDYLRAIRKKGDSFTNAEAENRYFLQRAKNKVAEIKNQQKICEKLQRSKK